VEEIKRRRGTQMREVRKAKTRRTGETKSNKPIGMSVVKRFFRLRAIMWN